MKPQPKSLSRSLFGAATLLASIVSTTPVWADYQGTVLDQGPVAYWRLSETAPVVNIPTTATNSGSLTVRNGNYQGDLAGRGAVGILTNDTAAHFDGSVEYILTTWHAAINSNANWSVETWFAPDTLTPSGGLLCVLSSGNFAAPRSGWLIYQSTTGFSIRFYNQNGTATSMNLTPVVHLTVGTYIHLVLTYDGTTARFYTNGVQAISGSPVGTPKFVPGVSGGFSIAARSDSGFPVPGKEDEVAYYASVLTPSQIAAHHDAAFTNSSANYVTLINNDSPLLYFHLDEPPLQNTVNAGSLGSAADGKFIYPVVSDVAGPSSPAFPGFEPSNVGVSVSGAANSAGAGGYVHAPALNLNTNGVTITGWIKPNGSQVGSAGAIMIRSQLTAPDTGTSAGLIFDEAGGLSLSYNWDGDDATYAWSSGEALGDGVWNYAALIVKPDSAIIYVPGTNAAPATNIHTHAVLAFDGSTFLGTDPAKSGFNGSLDEVAVFQRALSVGEVYSQYGAAVGGLQPRIFGDVQSPTGTLYAGDPLNLSVDAGGTPPLSYQWRKGGVPITGATNTSYSIASLVAGGPNTYDVVVTNSVNSLTSAGASVTVLAAAIPAITNNILATNRTIYPGGAINLSVSAYGGGLGYQWQWFGTNLPGQSSASLSLDPIGTTNAGPYRVVITNSAGSVTSLTATINIPTPAAGGYEAVISADGPIGWWRMDDAPGSTNLLDSEGRYDGAWNGTVTLGATGALTNDANTAATFNAPDHAWGQINSLPAPAATGDFTIEVWVRPTDSLGTESVPFSSFRPRYGFYFDKNTDGTWRGRDGYGDLDGTIVSRQALIGNVNLSQWTHLAAEFSSATGHRVFINGRWDGNSYIDFCRNLNTSMRIGAIDPLQNSGLQKFFTGDIDEVAIYSTALSTNQILNHYLTGRYSTNNAPVFAQQPQSQTVAVGTAASFTTVIEGSPVLTQQWYRNGAVITNVASTNVTLTLTNVSYADAIGKTYYVIASNGSGSKTSSVVTLTVTPQPSFALLTNNLVLHLKFDGDYTDSSGRGHNATAVGSPSIVQGQIGSGALQYTTVVDGPQGHGGNVLEADYLTLGVFTPGSSDLSFSNNVNFSVAYWFRTPTNTGSGDLPILCSAISSYQNYGLTFAPTYNSSRAGGWSWSLGDGSTYAGTYGPAGSTFDGSWHHLVHTFNWATGQGITYLDGALQVGYTVGISVLNDIDSGNSFSIGQDPTGHYAEAATNYVDDLAVWRGRVLTANEAYSAYYVGKTYGRSFDTVYPITIQATMVDGNLYIVWQTGTLYWADDVTGPYTAVPGASPPYYLATPLATKKFFEVK